MVDGYNKYNYKLILGLVLKKSQLSFSVGLKLSLQGCGYMAFITSMLRSLSGCLAICHEIDYFGIHINETYLHTSVRCCCIATGAGLHVFGSTTVLIIEDCAKI